MPGARGGTIGGGRVGGPGGRGPSPGIRSIPISFGGGPERGSSFGYSPTPKLNPFKMDILHVSPPVLTDRRISIPKFSPIAVNNTSERSLPPRNSPPAPKPFVIGPDAMIAILRRDSFIINGPPLNNAKEFSGSKLQNAKSIDTFPSATSSNLTHTIDYQSSLSNKFKQEQIIRELREIAHEQKTIQLKPTRQPIPQHETQIPRTPTTELQPEELPTIEIHSPSPPEMVMESERQQEVPTVSNADQKPQLDPHTSLRIKTANSNDIQPTPPVNSKKENNSPDNEDKTRGLKYAPLTISERAKMITHTVLKILRRSGEYDGKTLKGSAVVKELPNLSRPPKVLVSPVLLEEKNAAGDGSLIELYYLISHTKFTLKTVMQDSTKLSLRTPAIEASTTSVIEPTREDIKRVFLGRHVQFLDQPLAHTARTDKTQTQQALPAFFNLKEKLEKVLPIINQNSRRLRRTTHPPSYISSIAA